MKKHTIITIGLFLITNLVFGETYLDSLRSRALEQNPEIQLLQYNIEALQEKEVMVQKLMDPMLAIEYSNVPLDSWKLDESAMSGIQFKLMQTIPFPGKNKAREEIVSSEILSNNWQLEELKNMLNFNVEKTYYNLYMIRELRKISEDHIIILQQMVNSLQFKYETGKIQQHNYLKLNLLLSKIKDDIEDFKQADIQISAALKAVISEEGSLEITTEDLPVLELHAKDNNELIEIAKKNRPLLKKIEEDMRGSRLSMKLANLERLPDITFWSGYRLRKDIGPMPGEDLISVGISFPLPFDLKGRSKAKYNFAGFKEKQKEQKYLKEIDLIGSQLETAISKWERNLQKVRTYEKDLIPEAQTVLDLVMKSYETGRSDFSAVYQAQLQLIEFERILTRTKFNSYIIKSEIEKTLGFDTKEN